ncbi:MAG: hypothetical protein CMN76_18720 [Spirochaetaceae bacterium]|nr:hypothetical protein [Spirochaetaceae bacterium]|tara:strand:- start:129 stop:716 length:588 start_codon:yes stop_codon:yes gene_type:complete
MRLLPANCALAVAVVVLVAAPHCKKERHGVLNSHPGFEISKGILYLNGEPFNGIMRTDFPQGWKETPMINGSIHGVEHEWYNDGRMATERPYEHGKRVGVHRGWYPSGQIRFYYEYENDRQHGEAFSWHSNGKLFTYSRFVDGRPLGQKTWRENGQIYANYVQVNRHRQMGLMGSDLCNGVKQSIPDLLQQANGK